MATHPLVGTWIVDRNPADPSEMPTTNVLTADGGLIDPSVGAAGVWVATDACTMVSAFPQRRCLDTQWRRSRQLFQPFLLRPAALKVVRSAPVTRGDGW